MLLIATDFRVDLLWTTRASSAQLPAPTIRIALGNNPPFRAPTIEPNCIKRKKSPVANATGLK
jgi:hypothetical protein